MGTTVGLRERKRMAAMRRIQQAALDLFDQRGYDGVTIEQIAEAAEVSPSSVYRYFGTKEQVVLRDETDPQFFQRLEAELAERPPYDAIRRTVFAVMADYYDRDDALARRRTRYSLEEPAVRAVWARQVDELAGQIAGILRRAAGGAVDDLEAQVVASAVMWALAAAVRHWHGGGYATRLEDEFERALAVVERGLRSSS